MKRQFPVKDRGQGQRAVLTSLSIGIHTSLSLLAREHAVICGASRSGTGNLLQLIGLSALSCGPDVAQVWFLDAKQGLDYSFATKLAHARLYADVRDEHQHLLSDGPLASGFALATIELERRNTLMFGKARNIHEYRAKMGEQLPVIVLIVDELLGGTRADNLAMVKQAKQELGLVDTA